MSTRLPSPTDGVASSSDTSLSWQSRRELTGVAQGEGQRKTLDLIDRLKERERVANVLREQASLDNICRGMDDD